MPCLARGSSDAHSWDTPWLSSGDGDFFFSWPRFWIGGPLASQHLTLPWGGRETPTQQLLLAHRVPIADGAGLARCLKERGNRLAFHQPQTMTFSTHPWGGHLHSVIWHVSPGLVQASRATMQATCCRCSQLPGNFLTISVKHILQVHPGWGPASLTICFPCSANNS